MLNPWAKSLSSKKGTETRLVPFSLALVGWVRRCRAISLLRFIFVPFNRCLLSACCDYDVWAWWHRGVCCGQGSQKRWAGTRNLKSKWVSHAWYEDRLAKRAAWEYTRLTVPYGVVWENEAEAVDMSQVTEEFMHQTWTLFCDRLPLRGQTYDRAWCLIMLGAVW